MSGKKLSGDWLKRLGAGIVLVKFWCLLQNVIYPPPPLEAFNVDHKLGRTSGAEKDISTTTKQESTVMSAPIRVLQVILPPYFQIFLFYTRARCKSIPSS